MCRGPKERLVPQDLKVNQDQPQILEPQAPKATQVKKVIQALLDPQVHKVSQAQPLQKVTLVLGDPQVLRAFLD